MDKVTISNLQGESGLVNVVRYFMNNGNEYLIYSLNEVDEAGYTRLYVTKITGVDGTYSAETLNDNEWNEIKNIVKLIVKANKEGIPVPVQDLNPKKISNILLKDKKIFKLNAPLVNDLGANKPNFDIENNGSGAQDSLYNAQPTFEVPSTPTFEQPTFEVPSAPAFEQPTFETPSAPTFDFNGGLNSSMPFVNNAQNNGSTEDYKKMYENILEKNNELQEQINKLNTEIIQYKEQIDNIKNIIEK